MFENKQYECPDFVSGYSGKDCTFGYFGVPPSEFVDQLCYCEQRIFVDHEGKKGVLCCPHYWKKLAPKFPEDSFDLT